MVLTACRGSDGTVPAVSTPAPDLPAGVGDPSLQGIGLVEQLLGLRFCTAAELAAAHAAGLPTISYAAARELGVGHDDVLTAAAAGLDPYGYGVCRAAGDTHDEAVTGLTDIPAYLRWRPLHSTHDVVAAAHSCGLSHIALPGLTDAVGEHVAAGTSPTVIRLALLLTDGNFTAPQALAQAVPHVAELLSDADPSTVTIATSLAAGGWRGTVEDLIRTASAVAATERPTPGDFPARPAAGSATGWAWQAITSYRGRLDQPARLTLLAVAGHLDAVATYAGRDMFAPAVLQVGVTGVEFCDLAEEVGVTDATVWKYCRALYAAGLLVSADNRHFALPPAAWVAATDAS